MTSRQQPAIDEAVLSFMKRQKVPACSLSAGNRGGLHYAMGYGKASTAETATAKTIYRIGSLTKQFTAAMTLMAADKRSKNPIDLDATLDKQFPGMKRWSGITIRNLLNHTSGIDTYTASREWRLRQFRPVGQELLLKFVKGHKQKFDPGSRGQYSNSNYLLLAHILQDRTGIDLPTLLRQLIFTPLGMTDSRLISPAPPGPGIARGSVNGRYTSQRTHPNWALGVGDMQSTVLDIAKWNMSLFNKRLLSAESTELMFTAGVDNPEPAVKGEKFTMGWMDISANGTKRYYHQGYLHGFSAINYLENPQSGAGRFITILCNAHLVQKMPDLALKLAKLF